MGHIGHLEHGLSHQRHSVQVSSPDHVETLSEALQVLRASALDVKLGQVSEA